MKSFLKTHKKWLFPTLIVGIFLLLTYQTFDIIYPENYMDDTMTEIERNFANPLRLIFTGTIDRGEGTYSTYPFFLRLTITWKLLHYLAVVICGIGFLTNKNKWSKWLSFFLFLSLWISLSHLLNPMFYHALEVIGEYNGFSSASHSWNPWLTTFGYVLRNLPLPVLLIGLLYYLFDDVERYSDTIKNNNQLIPMSWLRFFNYHFDRYVLLFLGSTVLVTAYTNYRYVTLFEKPELVKLIGQLSFGVSITIAYFICESIFRRTPGKIITRSIVTSQEGNPGTLRILKRTLSRLIPFNAFSFLGNARWHDRFSNTELRLSIGKSTVRQFGRILKLILRTNFFIMIWLGLAAYCVSYDLTGMTFDEDVWHFPSILVAIFWLLSYFYFSFWLTYVAHYLDNIRKGKQRKTWIIYAYPYLFFIPFVNVYILMSLLTSIDESVFNVQKTYGERAKFYLTNLISLTGVLFFIVQILVLMGFYDLYTTRYYLDFKASTTVAILNLIVLPMFFHICNKIMKNINPWIERFENEVSEDPMETQENLLIK